MLTVVAIITIIAIVFLVYVWFWHINPKRVAPGVRRQPRPTETPPCSTDDIERFRAARVGSVAAREAMKMVVK